MLNQAVNSPPRQLSLFAPPSVAELPLGIIPAGVKERGAVFTRKETVEFILDLAGYTVDKPLHRVCLLEPSFGNGDFLLAVVERLLVSYAKNHPAYTSIVNDLTRAITAVELDDVSISTTRLKLMNFLIGSGVALADAKLLLSAWIVRDDFLLAEFSHRFTFVVGNPPYVRQELIPSDLLVKYRKRFETLYDRADLYVPFIERSLKLLEPGGVLGFICADRWMKNKYGGPLRALVGRNYHLKYYVDMVDTPAFHAEVSAYPAITVIIREKTGPTRLAHRPAIDRDTLKQLTTVLQAETVPSETGVIEVVDVVDGAEPWILHSFDQLELVRRLERTFPTLEEARCKVGIGVATGADRAFIAPFSELDVEPDCKLPLVTTKDLKGGKVVWQGLGVLNPFRDDGALIDLTTHPRFADYLEQHREKIINRNCARKNPGKWYRTIDRIYPEIVRQPKLLIPDIKGEACIVYEEGRLYPHHNLYFITSDEWDLHALQAVLKSGIAKLFVAIYSIQMRGGYLRFQAQYLRRIRVPRWADVSSPLRIALSEAALADDWEACNKATFELYELTDRERAAIGGNGN